MPKDGGRGQAKRSRGHVLRAYVGDDLRVGRVVVSAFELDCHLGQPVTAEVRTSVSAETRLVPVSTP